jgi:hypothetical protein
VELGYWEMVIEEGEQWCLWLQPSVVGVLDWQPTKGSTRGR